MVAKLRTTSGTKIPFTGSLINRRDWRGKTFTGKGRSASETRRKSMGHTEELQCQRRGIQQEQRNVEEEEHMFNMQEDVRTALDA